MNNSLLNSLRGGGYILYARHGDETVGIDQHNFDFLYCNTQRNLSDMGGRQAIYCGRMLYSLQIPISSPVIASPFCRTIETVQLSFGWQNVQVDPFRFEIYRLSKNLSNAEQKRILDTLETELEILPPQGSNKIIIAHSFQDEVGLGSISNMGTIIVKPRGKGNGYEIISKLSLLDLSNLPR